MSLIAGLNSYITLEEANEMLKGEKLYEQYAALSDEQKEKLLRDAALRIDLLNFTGRKKSVMQYMEFPRNYQNEVPYQVKYAQAAEAVCVLDTEAENRRMMQEQGVTSVTLGKVSESYSGTAAGSTALHGLHSSAAYALLRRYIAGSCPIV